MSNRDFNQSTNIFYICVIIYLIVGFYLTTYVESSDISIFLDIHRNRFADIIFSIFNLLGEPAVHFIAVVIVGFYNVKRGLIFGSLIGINMIVILALKLYFAKPRPLTFFNEQGMLEALNLTDYAQILTQDTSMPSYHSAGAFVLCVFLLLNFLKVYLVLILFLSAILTAVSRVYFFHHFFIDTFFGAIIGIFLTILIIQIASRNASKLNRWNASFLKLRAARQDINR